jgi:hypothetical protein
VISPENMPKRARLLFEVKVKQDEGESSEYFYWQIIRNNIAQHYPDKTCNKEEYSFYFTKEEIDKGEAEIEPKDLPFEKKIEYLAIIEEYRFLDEYRLIDKTTYIGGKKEEIHYINRDIKITLTGSYLATTFDAFGKLVEAEIQRKLTYWGARGGTLEVEISQDLKSFIMPGKYEVSFKSEIPDNSLWTINGEEAGRGGSSFGFTLAKNSSISITCIAEKYTVSKDDTNEEDDEEYYVLKRSYVMGWWFDAIIEKAVPAIDFGRCAVPYDLGNGICLDLKTGDAKIIQNDLNLPGRDGLDLVLNRVFSGLANFDLWYDAWGELKKGHSIFTENTSEHLWNNLRIPLIGDLRDDDSKSILTEPMPGWIYDLPRITPRFIYFEGKLYPNCLEADKSESYSDIYFYWPQGCEKIGNSYYFHDGNFRLTTNGDNSVTLTGSNGVSYVFPCKKDPDEEVRIYYPLDKIVGKSGNQISFKYSEDSVNIVDSVGRTIIVTRDGITVDGEPVVSFNVQYNGLISNEYWQDYQNIIYQVTDSIGRTSFVDMGFGRFDLQTFTGERANIVFKILPHNSSDLTQLSQLRLGR